MDIAPTDGSPASQLITHHPHCMGCGADNPAGLQMRLAGGPDVVQGEVRFRDEHQGPPGLVHGGAVAAALDDALALLVVALERVAFTARLEVDFRRPVPINRPCRVRARCERIEGRKLWLSADLTAGGQTVAEASGLFVELVERAPARDRTDGAVR